MRKKTYETNPAGDSSLLRPQNPKGISLIKNYALGQAPAKGHKEVQAGHLMESPILGSLQRGGKGKIAQDRELD